MTACPDEQTQQHEHSPCTVADGETVCRAAYDPMHKKASGAIKNSFVKSADLLGGELSIWRLARDPAFDLEALVAVLKNVAPADQELWRILSATALAIRGVRLPEFLGDDQRVFCVIDDCTTDNDGGWHAEHAVVRLEQIDGFDWTQQNDPFDAAKEALAVLLKSNAVWPLAA